MIVRLLERRIETPLSHVLLDLPVPLIGHELLKPLGKPGKFGSRETGHDEFKFFDAHGS